MAPDADAIAATEKRLKASESQGDPVVSESPSSFLERVQPKPAVSLPDARELPGDDPVPQAGLSAEERDAALAALALEDELLFG